MIALTGMNLATAFTISCEMPDGLVNFGGRTRMPGRKTLSVQHQVTGSNRMPTMQTLCTHVQRPGIRSGEELISQFILVLPMMIITSCLGMLIVLMATRSWSGSALIAVQRWLIVVIGIRPLMDCN
ncbi:MAG: hypothetical protein BA866_04905 [Desulfobulbaceae bacterium S5133MH15]|nr:MAG: hypothetical protein BA866_04905 [Desulfobulbaceae bacterium S5133MH15]